LTCKLKEPHKKPKIKPPPSGTGEVKPQPIQTQKGDILLNKEDQDFIWNLLPK